MARHPSGWWSPRVPGRLMFLIVHMTGQGGNLRGLKSPIFLGIMILSMTMDSHAQYGFLMCASSLSEGSQRNGSCPMLLPATHRGANEQKQNCFLLSLQCLLDAFIKCSLRVECISIKLTLRFIHCPYNLAKQYWRCNHFGWGDGSENYCLSFCAYVVLDDSLSQGQLTTLQNLFTASRVDWTF